MTRLSGEVETLELVFSARWQDWEFRMTRLSGEVETIREFMSLMGLMKMFRMTRLSGEVETRVCCQPRFPG